MLRMLAVVSLSTAAMMCGGASAAEVDDLRFRITVPERGVLYQHVPVIYRLENRTGEPINANYSMEAGIGMNLFVVDSEGKRSKVHTSAAGAMKKRMRESPAGEVYVGMINLVFRDRTEEWIFPEAGTYQIEGEWLIADDTRMVKLTAEPHSIVVADPAEGDLAAMQYLGSVEGTVTFSV